MERCEEEKKSLNGTLDGEGPIVQSAIVSIHFVKGHHCAMGHGMEERENVAYSWDISCLEWNQFLLGKCNSGLMRP